MAETLDSALKARLRDVLSREKPVTEAELRALFEEGRACALILRGELERSRGRLVQLSADPTSPLARIAKTARRVNELAPDLDELEALLAELEERARELRAQWLSIR